MTHHLSIAGPAVVGVGMTRFGKHLDRSLRDLAGEAVSAALLDAEITDWPADQPVFFANAAGGSITGQEMIAGQVALIGSPLAGAPFINVENACASGGTALHLAVGAVASGTADLACAIGAEKLFHPDRERSLSAIRGGTNLLDPMLSESGQPPAGSGGSVMMDRYAELARAYLVRAMVGAETLAMVAVKNRKHATQNPLAQFRKPLAIDDVLAARTIVDPLTLPMCSPISDGAAAVIVASEPHGRSFARSVTVRSSTLVSYRQPPSDDVVMRAARTALADARLNVFDLDIVEVHDASAIAEILQYEAIGLSPPNKGHQLLMSGETQLGGRLPVNVSGGLLSRGHPLAATGCAQVFEIVEQLREHGGERQVHNASRGLALNAGGWMGDDYAAATAMVLSRTDL